jgi:RNA polymerase sigma-70 factor (ECF subfamily)
MSIWGMESGGWPRVQDVDRLTDLYQAYLKLVWRTLRGAGVRAADLDDVTHDVFLVVRRKLLTSDPVPFTPGMSPEEHERAWSAWISRVAFYEAKNYRSRASHHR